MGHVGLKLATFTLVHYFLCHLIGTWPVKSGSVCFGHDGLRGRMMTTGSRVDVIQDHSTFFWCYAFLADSSHTFFEQLCSYHSKGFGSTDDLSSLFFILWELFPKNVRNVRHCPIGGDDQNLHDQIDHGWDLDFNWISGTLWLWGLFSEMIFLN